MKLSLCCLTNVMERLRQVMALPPAIRKRWPWTRFPSVPKGAGSHFSVKSNAIFYSNVQRMTHEQITPHNPTPPPQASVLSEQQRWACGLFAVWYFNPFRQSMGVRRRLCPNHTDLLQCKQWAQGNHAVEGKWGGVGSFGIGQVDESNFVASLGKKGRIAI